MARDIGLIQAEAEQSPETAEAQNELGMRYFMGHGRGKDFYLAADYFRKAAEQGDAMAQYNLGRCYHFVKNAEDAAIWYEKAAEQGYAPARAKLEEMRTPKLDSVRTPKRRRGRVKGTMPKGI